MKKLRILVLMHEDLVPPDSIEGLSDEEIADWKSEYDVCAGLEALGHDVYPLGLSDDLGLVRNAIRRHKPHIAFNLLEEFHGVAVYDQHVVSYLELIKQPYTGCNPRGLMLSHDKALCKQILSYHRIPTPKFTVFERGKRVRRSARVSFPLMIKSVNEEASMGISQKSIVHNEAQLADRVAYIHEQVRTDALAEEYIEGRELYVGLIGNQRLTAFPVWEMLFTKMPDGMARIATRRVKWDAKTQKEFGIKTQAARNLPPVVQRQITSLCKRVYRSLSISGYARMDFRLAEDGRVYLLEANPNPNLEYGEDFAESAERAGISYETLLHRILNLGLNYKAAWRG
jgi:D-alanine-D-alanine ligase